ncbi:MAG: MurR/RpiR family transcriptional regulator [Pelagimonas sp.]|nr:MurR/RpiR family transcriptional regulator [Pelagimonas sp.]
MTETYEQRLADRYDALSARLQAAADYVAQNPVDIATRSLRAVSEDTGFAPVTFTRLSKALGYGNFEELRQDLSHNISKRINNFADRASRLQMEHSNGTSSFFTAHVTACLNNVEQMAAQIDQDLLANVVDKLYSARDVILYGNLGSTGLVEYISYMADFSVGNWKLAGRMGSSLGVSLSQMDDQDAMVVVTKPPFSASVLRAARLAHERGVYVVVITDTHSCPALRNCAAHFIVPTDSPHFYSSYAASTVLAESLIGMLVSRAGPEAQARIARIEESNRHLQIVSDG